MSITYLTWTPEESYETQGTATDACSEVDQALDEYREEGEGWPDTADSIAAFVAVPICVVEEVTADDGGLEYDHRDVNAGLLAIIEAKSALDVQGVDDLRAEVQKIINASMIYDSKLMDTEWAKIGALCAAAIDRLAAADAGGVK